MFNKSTVFKYFFRLSIVFLTVQGWAEVPKELLLIKDRLDQAEGQKLSSRRARDFTYEILARLASWLHYSDFTQEATPILLQILSKTQKLSEEMLSPWDQSFLELIRKSNSDGVYPITLKNGIIRLLNQIKTEELVLIERNYSMGANQCSTEINALVKVANWLSTIKPSRALKSSEKEILTRLVSKFKILSDSSDSDWDSFLKELNSKLNPEFSFSALFRTGKLRASVSSDSIESLIHNGLHTGLKLEKGFDSLGESRLLEKILDFIPESELNLKGQINQNWKRWISLYHKLKQYPLDQLPKEESGEKRENEAILKTPFHRHQEYRIFLNSFSKVIINSIPNTRIMLDQLALELKDQLPKPALSSKLNRLNEEIVRSVLSAHSRLSDEGKQILDEYEVLAEAGNIYAQQLISWVQEFTKLSIEARDFFYPENQPDIPLNQREISNFKWPISFPDINVYKRYNTVSESPLDSFSLYAEFQRVNRPAYSKFKPKAQWTETSELELQIEQQISELELPTFSPLSQPQKDVDEGIEDDLALLQSEFQLLESKRPKGIDSKNDSEFSIKMGRVKTGLGLYHLISASDFSKGPLFEGRDEQMQQVILRYLENRQRLGETALPRSLLNHRPNSKVSHFLSTLTSENFCDPILCDEKGHLGHKGRQPEVFYWLGEGKQRSGNPAKTSMNKISALDLDIHSDFIALSEDIPENKQARRVLAEILHPSMPRYRHPTLKSLIKLGKVSELLLIPPMPYIEDQENLHIALAFLEQGEFEKSISFFEKVDAKGFHSFTFEPIWLTRFAQAYFGKKDFKSTIRILEKKKNPFNHVDHNLYIQSLFELNEKCELGKAFIARRNFEEKVLLPDLITAAKIYEEDGDEDRAEQVKMKISQIEKKTEEKKDLLRFFDLFGERFSDTAFY